MACGRVALGFVPNFEDGLLRIEQLNEAPFAMAGRSIKDLFPGH